MYRHFFSGRWRHGLGTLVAGVEFSSTMYNDLQKGAGRIRSACTCHMTAPLHTPLHNSSGNPPCMAVPDRSVHYSKLGMDGFTDIRYNTAADNFLEHAETVVDGLEHEGIEDITCNGGVLTIETTEHGIFIINKQAPTVQLWLSSPMSGPHHYNMVVRSHTEEDGTLTEDVRWLCDHDGHDLQTRLQEELSSVLGVEVRL